MKREIAECKKCGHVWLPRQATGKPRICPNCKSARWDVGPIQPKEGTNELRQPTAATATHDTAT